jgi:hypothetical protein
MERLTPLQKVISEIGNEYPEIIKLLQDNLEYEQKCMLEDWSYWHKIGYEDGENGYSESEIYPQIFHDMENYIKDKYNGSASTTHMSRN